LTKASLYVYFGPVAILVCRRFDHTSVGNRTTRRQTNSRSVKLLTAQLAD